MRTISTIFKIREINTFKYKSVEYVVLLLYLPNKNNVGLFIYALLQFIIYLVKKLPLNLLINNPILNQKNIVINIIKKTLVMKSDNIIISINTK